MPKTAERQLLQPNDCLPKRPEPRSVDSRTLCPEKVGRSSKLKSEYLLHTQACYTSAIRASEATSQREEKHVHGAEHPKTFFTDRHRARPDLVARGAPIISGSSHITSSARANPLCGGPPNADQADPPPPPAVLPTKAQQAPPRRRPPGVATTIGEGRTLSSPSSICWLQAWSRTPGRKVPRVTIRALQQQRQFR